LLLLAAGVAGSCSVQDKIDLSTGWKISTDDNFEFRNPAYDDSTWGTVDLPAFLSRDVKRQVFWLRKSFVMPGEYRDRDLAVSLGKVWDAERTYLNGVKIGAAGWEQPHYFSLWNYDRYYIIPENLAKPGEKNIIAIRMFTNNVSLFEGEPFVAGLRAVMLHNFFKRLQAEYIVIGLTILSFFLGVVFFIQYLTYRKYIVSLYYALCSAVLTLASLQWYLPDISVISYVAKDNLYYVLMAIAIALFYFLIESLLDESIRAFRIFMIGMVSVLALTCFTATYDDPLQGWRYPIIALTATSSQVCWGIVILKSFLKARTAKSYIILGGYLVFMTCMFHDLLLVLGVARPGLFILPLGYHALFICMGVVLSLNSSEFMRSDELKRYLPAQLVDSIIRGERNVKYETERRKLTIFFSDIKSFTETTDNMEAEELAGLLNEYLSDMTRIAHEHGGTIDKFVGDAIMVFFGAPGSAGERTDALACVRMAIAMQYRMKALQEKWYNEGVENPLEIRIGVNTGVATVGNFGSADRLSYTAIGGQVNLASRLESICGPGGILISHATWALVKDEVPCTRREEKLTVKGIHREITVYDVMI